MSGPYVALHSVSHHFSCVDHPLSKEAPTLLIRRSVVGTTHCGGNVQRPRRAAPRKGQVDERSHVCELSARVWPAAGEGTLRRHSDGLRQRPQRLTVWPTWQRFAARPSRVATAAQRRADASSGLEKREEPNFDWEAMFDEAQAAIGVALLHHYDYTLPAPPTWAVVP